VEKLCRHGSVIAGRDDSGKPENVLFTAATRRAPWTNQAAATEKGGLLLAKSATAGQLKAKIE